MNKKIWIGIIAVVAVVAIAAFFMMGGKKKVLDDLQWMFKKTPEDMFWNLYYNHANEPVHGVPYLFNRLDAPWLTQYWTRFICKNAYENKVAGLKGNEDVGQMSAWYVLSAIGLHPYCPGETRTEITSPVFDRITIQLPATGKTFTIVAENNSDENIYIQTCKLPIHGINQRYKCIIHRYMESSISTLQRIGIKGSLFTTAKPNRPDFIIDTIFLYLKNILTIFIT